MRKLTYTLILFFFVNCSLKHTDNNSKTGNINPEKISNDITKDKFKTLKEIESKPSVKRINLDSNLNQKHNEYLASIDDDVLSLCCYEIMDVIKFIDYKKMKKITENYNLKNQKKTVDVYYSGKSFLKKYYNDHYQIRHIDLICGRIDNNNLINNETIQIGMFKHDLLEIIFEPTETFAKINRLDIYENEIGESHTSYRFTNDTLTEIVFDSVYDWVNKELK